MTMILAALAASLAAQGTVQSAPPISGGTLGMVNYLDLEAGVGYATNPYLALGNRTGRALVRASAHAVHTRYSARTSTTLSAYAENINYLGRYGSQFLVQLSAHHDASVTEKLRLFGDLTGSLDRSGQLGTRFISVGPLLDPTSPATPLPSLTDPQVGFVVPGGRTYRLGGQFGAQFALSAVDSLTARTGVDHFILRGTSIDNSYNVYLASAGYDRRVNARTSIGGQLTLQSTRYSGANAISFPDVTVITPQATGHFDLSDRTSFSSAIGVSFAAISIAGSKRHSTGLALNVSLCHRGERDQLCATIARAQQSATTAGPVTVLTAGVSYSKSFGSNQTLQLSASGSRYSQSFNNLGATTLAGRSSYLSGGASYTCRLGPRLYSGASGSWRKIFREAHVQTGDVTGSLFLRFRLGDRQ